MERMTLRGTRGQSRYFALCNQQAAAQAQIAYFWGLADKKHLAKFRVAKRR